MIRFLEGKSGSSMDLVILRFGSRRTVKVKMAQEGPHRRWRETPIKQPTDIHLAGCGYKRLTRR